MVISVAYLFSQHQALDRYRECAKCRISSKKCGGLSDTLQKVHGYFNPQMWLSQLHSLVPKGHAINLRSRGRAWERGYQLHVWSHSSWHWTDVRNVYNGQLGKKCNWMVEWMTVPYLVHFARQSSDHICGLFTRHMPSSCHNTCYSARVDCHNTCYSGDTLYTPFSLKSVWEMKLNAGVTWQHSGATEITVATNNHLFFAV